jgi:murein DD-endopeptidase MepM/ murein hydrolase activator NlpD
MRGDMAVSTEALSGNSASGARPRPKLDFGRGLGYGVVLIAVGWVIGSLYPAPRALIQPIAARMPAVAERLGLSDLNMARLSELLSPEQLARLRQDASQLAAASGEAIMIERTEGPVEMQSDAMETVVNAAPREQGAFEASLSLCPRMSVSNAPAADAAGLVRNFRPVVDVNGVKLAAAPTVGACLSSAFGARSGRMHKGLDLHAANGGPILAAGDGTVIERKYRDDYGNMLLIDHGRGIYTRYAHLSSFASEAVVGARVAAGQQLGLMGNTASYQIPVHLHYELLLGDYANPRGSFGLTPRSPFEFPPAR